MRGFDDVLTKTINEVIRNVFEDETAKIIFEYLNESNSKNLDEKVRVFTNALPKILGVGSVIIEDLILETLYSKYGSELKWRKGYRFADYIIELRDQTRKGES